MAKILVVLPFSGANVGAGLANVNQELTKALSGERHDVKLLTVRLPEHSALDPVAHGNAEIVYLPNIPEAMEMPKVNQSDDARARLYEIINAAPGKAATVEKLGLPSGWVPDIIIGHSRFSGPAAITLRNKFYPDAKAYYFIHSIPVEGVIVKGIGINAADTSSAKLEMELEWMTKADVIVPVGPLIRLGVRKMLKDAGKIGQFRVHEFIAGIEMTGEPVEFIPPDLNGRPYVFLMLGRAEAPLKGFQDMILAAMHLRDRNTNIMLRIRGYNADRSRLEEIQRFVNEITNPGDEMRNRIEVLPFTSDQEDLRNDVKKAHGILMPSYWEHFGLSPMNGVAFGVPILVNELSGFGMFVGDPKRFGAEGGPCVVHDFDPTKKRPLSMDDIAAAGADAFDNRPIAWAKAMQDLTENLRVRFADAKKIREVFQGYTWPDSVRALLEAKEDKYHKMITVQDRGGQVTELQG